MRFTAVVAAFSFALGAQELEHVTPPTVIYKVEPQYTDEEARLVRLEGKVVLKITVGADGIPRHPEVVRYLGLGLDQEAISAVKSWRFRPGMKDGAPVDTPEQIVEVDFRLKDQAKWHVQQIGLRVGNTFGWPVITTVVPPRVEEGASAAKATLVFDANDDNGIPINVRVITSTDDEWANDVMDAVRQWRYSAIQNNGRAYAAQYFIELVRGDFVRGN